MSEMNLNLHTLDDSVVGHVLGHLMLDDDLRAAFNGDDQDRVSKAFIVAAYRALVTQGPPSGRPAGTSRVYRNVFDALGW
jgi:hypothetical protein